MILILGLAKPLPFAVRADFAEVENSKNINKNTVVMVPVERIELPTFGLQNMSRGVHANSSCGCATTITVISRSLKPKVGFLNLILIGSGQA